MLVENLAEKVIECFKELSDAIKAYSGIENIEIIKEVTAYVKITRSRYQNYLDG